MKGHVTVWFVDMEGNEDFLLVEATRQEQQEIEDHLQKYKESQVVSDFVVLRASAESAKEAIEYITEKLQ